MAVGPSRYGRSRQDSRGRQQGNTRDVHHPWRAIRELADWTVYWAHDLPEGVNGVTRWSDKTIWLRHGLSQVQRRCVIEHERHHVIRGPGGAIAVEERAVDIATAHALISLEDLIRAAQWSRSLPELADELNVTQKVAQVRLNHLHPAERAALRRAMPARNQDDDGQEGVA